MIPIRIDDADDPRIAAYRDIRERDLKGRHGLFVAEGKVVLNVLFGARRFEADSVLLLENRLAGMAETLALAPPDMPVYVADAAVLDRIAGFHLHRGVLAIGRRRAEDGAESLLRSLPDDALVVALVGISNHDNVGSIFRNAAAFGVDAVLLDRTCCDPLYRKAIRVSVGAALKVPFAIAADAEEMIAALAAQRFEQFALSPAGETDIRDVVPAGRVALFLGTEGEGLPPNILSRLKTVRIGMKPGFDSLNVAAASAVALHRLMRGDQ
jgi:tRNA G18 (ribose-2'-O)-methylase SpoU